MPAGNPRLPYPVSNIGMNHQIQPGYRVRFLSPLLYYHWGIIADTLGSDGEYQVISVHKNADKIYKQNFSDAGKHGYAVITMENAQEVCQRAMSCIGESWSYDLMTNNCEHFVEQITTGRRQSGQALGAGIGACGGALIGIAQKKDIVGIAIDALIGAGIGMMANNLAQPGGTQMTYQPRIKRRFHRGGIRVSTAANAREPVRGVLTDV